MNKHYVNIKVDREERPDVDKVYMNFVQVISNYDLKYLKHCSSFH
jgi:hypothetical protein